MVMVLKIFLVFEVMFNLLVKGVVSYDYEWVLENCIELINKFN